MTYRATLPGDATVVVTTASAGDFSAAPVASLCSTVHQIHGDRVYVVDRGQTGLCGDGDALVSTSSEVALAVRGADCPLIGFSCAEGVIGAVHAGWKGLHVGVIDQAVAVMRNLGATDIAAVVGPFIGPECYEFSENELSMMTDQFGASAWGVTASGAPALDLDACLTVSFERLGVFRQHTLGARTVCSGEFYSWRKRKDTARHALVISKSIDVVAACER